MHDGSAYRSRLAALSARAVGRRYLLQSAGAAGAGLAAIGLIGCSSSSNNNTSSSSNAGNTSATKAAPSVASGVSTPAATRAAGSPAAGSTPAATAAAVTGNVNTSGTAKVGGAYRVYGDIAQDPNDPTTSVNTAAGFWLYIGDTAITVDPVKNVLTPALIQKWEQPAPDQVVLHVRNANWQNKAPVNGRAVTADDIANALLAHAGKLDQTGGKAIYPRASTFAGVDSITATDATTVTIKLKSPTIAFLPNIADWRLPMFPKEQLTVGFADSNKLVGSGPWTVDPGFADGKDYGGSYSLTRNASYWDTGRPYFNTIQSTTNQDQAARTNAFIGGTIDSLATFRSPKVEIDALIKRKSDAQFVSWQFGHWHYTAFNATKAPWTDPRVRRAVFLALDYAAMGDGFYGQGNWQYTGPLVYTFFDTALQPADLAKMPGWNPSTKAQDITAAKQLMTAAGFPDGNIQVSDLVFGLPMDVANSTRLQQQLQQVWPKMTVTLDSKPDSATFYGQTSQLGFDLQCASIYPVPDPATQMISSFGTKASRNYGAYSNPMVDSILASALTEFDAGQLKSKLMAAQTQLIQDMPVIPFYAANLTALFQANIRGLQNAVGPGVSSQVVKQLWSASA